MVLSTLEIWAFFSFYILYRPVLYIVHIIHIFFKNYQTSLKIVFAPNKQGGNSELYVCAEGYYLWFTFNFNGGKMIL